MDPERLEIVIFEVAGQRHAVAVASVQELLPAIAITPVPGSAPDYEGVINLRGVVVPVVDMRRRFGMPPRNMAISDHLIVVRSRARLVALHVDHAVELVRVDRSAVAASDPVDGQPPETGGRKRPAVVQFNGGLVLLHSVEALADSQILLPTLHTDAEVMQS